MNESRIRQTTRTDDVMWP